MRNNKYPVAVQIVVGDTLITEQNKSIPIPQVPLGDPFQIEVTWGNNADPTLTIRFSDFKLVTFDPCYTNGQLWNPAPENPRGVFGIQLQDEDGKAIPYIEVTNNQGGNPSYETMRLDRTLPVQEIPQPQLIMFKQTLLINGRTVFEHDPPWVGKPPTG